MIQLSARALFIIAAFAIAILIVGAFAYLSRCVGAAHEAPNAGRGADSRAE